MAAIRTILFAVSVSFLAVGVLGQSLSLDYVDGSGSPGSIVSGQRISFDVRMTLDSLGCKGFTNGFRIYSPDGAQWSATTGGWTGAIDSSMCEKFWILPYSVTGSGADTIGFAGLRWTLPTGIPPYFDEVVLTVAIGPMSPEQEGLTICLDSSFYPPSGRWLWVAENDESESMYPSWDGPHCFTVSPSPHCCRFRGDVEDKGAGPVHVGDLVWLTEYVYEGGPAPPCMEQADVNADGVVDEADVIYLADHMFSGGPAPVPCDSYGLAVGKD